MLPYVLWAVGFVCFSVLVLLCLTWIDEFAAELEREMERRGVNYYV